jgi:hypothetical protein
MTQLWYNTRRKKGIVVMRTANCKVCGVKFVPNNGTHKICSDGCRQEQAKRARDKWRHKAKEKWSGYSKAYRERHPYKAKVVSFKAKATKAGLPFNLDEEWFRDNTPTHCPVLGILLDQGDRDNVSSVDRMIPEKGYTKENCSIISLKANRLKSNATIEELEKIIAFMKKSS